MLSVDQQKEVWDGWLSSEIRSNYFADLSWRLLSFQRKLTWAILICSSGAVAVVVRDWLPAQWNFLKPTLVLGTASLSLWSLVQQYQKNATDCADLHFRWNRLAAEYQALWNDMYSRNATTKLATLAEKRAELSKSGTAFPNKKRLMLRWQEHVERHRASQRQRQIA